PCARASRSIGMPPTSSCVNFVSTSTASSKRFACALSARAAAAEPHSAIATIGTTNEIQRETNGVREKLRIEHLRAEVAAMVAGKAGQTEKDLPGASRGQSAVRASGAA